MDTPTVAPLLPEVRARLDQAANSAAATAPAADFQSFLTLLTAQLRNQDPLQPLDSTQFVAQLASFSTVEQLIGTNSRLDLLSERAEAADLASLSGWIGRLASATDGSFRASGGAEAFQVPVLNGAERVEAIVFRADGAEIDRFAVASDSAGQAIWSGAATATVAPGTALRIELVYHGAGLVLDRRPAGVFREVTGIRGTPDGAVLDLADGGTLSPGKVAELRARDGAGSSGSPPVSG
jgi:flagellar basal-body rod modification protein FlgD